MCAIMSFLRCIHLIVICLVLSSCVADRLLFWQDDALNKNYTVSGLEGHPEVQEYISTLVDDRFASFQSDENMDMAAALSYHQEVVRRDLIKGMKAKGFYEAHISYSDLDEKNGVYQVNSGKRSIVKTLQITPSSYDEILDDLPLGEGKPLIAADVLAAQKTIHKELQKKSCAFDLFVSHKALLDRGDNTAKITFNVRQGKPASYGDISFIGNTDVSESFLQKHLTIKQGDCFRHDGIEKTRDKILSSGLFSRVDVVLPENNQQGGPIPVIFKVKERKQRTIKTGLSYYTDEGVGATAGWEHRNFFGSGEKVNVDLTLSTLEQSLGAKMKKPFFMRDDQSLLLNAEVKRSDTDAYEEIGFGTGFDISRQLNKRLSASVGSKIDISQIKENNEETKTFGLLSPHTSLKYDSRDDKLDPHKGWLLSADFEGFVDVLGEASPFVKSELGAQTYYEVNKRLVLAGRTKIGTIAGTETDDIPATERFFAGGGGSVRGFGHQEIGPQESDGDPAGGRSLFEASFETRLKFTDTLGMVAFVDTGHVGDKVIPTFDSLSIGAGVGARYYTDFGPLRLDVGVPLSGDENTDQNFQVYISIGQAF